VGAADWGALERFTRAISQSCNLLAAAEGLVAGGHLAGGLAEIVGASGPTQTDQLGRGDGRRHFFAGKKGGAEVGNTKKGKGTKTMLMIDGEGTPLSAFITSANHAEVNAIETLVDTRVSEKQPRRIVYDRAADAEWIRASLAARQIELVCPHRRGRKKPSLQDGRPLRRYRRRFKVERTIAWLMNLRRLVVRYEYHDYLFEGFVQLGCLFTIIKWF
jgi:transposase